MEEPELPPEPNEWFMPWRWNWTAEPSLPFILFVMAMLTWAGVAIQALFRAVGVNWC